MRILTDAPAVATSPLLFVDSAAGRDYPKWAADGPNFYFPEQKIDAAIAKVFCVIAPFLAEKASLMSTTLSLTLRSVTLLLCIMLAVAATSAQATVVRFATSLGNIDVRMYDAATPLTVANFLTYTSSNAYDGTFIHRAPHNFVLQGGGFTMTPPNIVNEVESGPSVLNEFGISNISGTLAMAKTGAGPNTATNQWFFSVGDNSSNLDNQNGGFTVFGRVIGNGLSVINAINALPKYNLQSNISTNPDAVTFGYVPLRGDNSQTLANRVVYMNDVAPLNIPAGDFNIDGKVDAADLAVWKTDFGSTTKAAADGNGNGRVDAADLLIWQRTFGQNFGAPAAGAVAAVPEPAAATLALFAAAVCGLARRRSQ